MSVLNPEHPNSLANGLSVPAWLALFLSPTAYVLLLILIARLQAPAPPGNLVVLLFGLIPVAALVVCGMTVWRSRMSVSAKVGGVALTALAMLLQCGFWFILIISAINAAIALP